MTQDLSLDNFDTRDLLLLSQLIEQHGLLHIELVHSAFIDHPAFLLSHNELEGKAMEFTPEQLRSLIDQLFAAYPNKNIIQLCELFYAQRIEELKSEIAHNQTLFHKAKEAL
jgi:hypothetical protein